MLSNKGPRRRPASHCFALDNKQSELEMLQTFHLGWQLVILTGEEMRGLDDRDCGKSEAVASRVYR